MVLRTTEIVNAFWKKIVPGWLSSMVKVDDSRPETTEEGILVWSGKFGTAMHSLCLEGIAHSYEGFEKKLADGCYKQFLAWKMKYNPKFFFVEKNFEYKDEVGDVIFTGTADGGVRIKGEKILLDLKFWGIWRWMFGYELPSSKEINSTKAAKTNLQTGLYKEGVKNDFRAKKRAVLWITPFFYIYKEFTRESQKLDAAFAYAKDQKPKDEDY